MRRCSYSDTDSNTNAYSNAKAIADSDTNSYSDAKAIANTDSNSNPNSDSDADRNADPDSYADADGNSDPDTKSNPHVGIRAAVPNSVQQDKDPGILQGRHRRSVSLD